MRIFISHANEDKAAIARPLAEALLGAGFDVWFDEYSLTLGDNLRRSIDKGLSECDFGVVVLSKSFFRKEWPKKELDSLFQREHEGQNVILPIWHGVDREEVAKHSGALANKISVSSSADLNEIVMRISIAVKKLYQYNLAPKSAARNDFLAAHKYLLMIKFDGERLIQDIRANWLAITGFDESVIDSVEINFHGDAGGINDYSSGIFLADGSSVPLTRQVFLDTIASMSTVTPRYTPIEFVIDDVAFSGYHDIDISETTVYVLCIRALPSEPATNDVTARLRALADNRRLMPITCLPEELTDELFGQGDITERLVDLLTTNREWAELEDLIFDLHLAGSRWPFLYASTFVKRLKYLSLSAVSDGLRLLMQRLVSEDALNSYWKTRARSSLLSTLAGRFPDMKSWNPKLPIEIHGVVDGRSPIMARGLWC